MSSSDPPPYDPPWADGIITAANISSLISMVLVLFPISTYLIFKKQKRTQLPLYMCIASLGLNLSSNMGTYKNDYVCLYEAAGIEFFSMATVLWWLCMSYNFYLVSVKEVPSRKVLQYEPRYNVFVWVYSSVITLIAIVTDNLDIVRREHSYVCWIREDRWGNQWWFYYIHLVVVFLIGLLFWPRSLYRLYRVHVYQEPNERQLMIYVRQVLFIVFFCLFFAFMLAFRVLTDAVFHGPNFGMSVVHMLAFTATGTYMFFIFGLSPENLRLWRLACGCQPEKSKHEPGSHTEFVQQQQEPLIGVTKIPDGSLSYVNVAKYYDEHNGNGMGYTHTLSVIPEPIQRYDFHTAPTVVSEPTKTGVGTPGTPGTGGPLAFTPETGPSTPITRDMEKISPRTSSRNSFQPPITPTQPTRSASQPHLHQQHMVSIQDHHDPTSPTHGHHHYQQQQYYQQQQQQKYYQQQQRKVASLLPKPPQLSINNNNRTGGGRVISSRGHERDDDDDDVDVDGDEETDYIEMDR